MQQLNVSYIITSENITLVFPEKSKTFLVGKDENIYNVVIEKIKENKILELFEFLNIEYKIKNFKGLTFHNDEIYYNGAKVDNYISQKIMNYRNNGLPFEALFQFLGKVLKNPSEHTREYLYRFLENGNMPITPTGNFLGYKAVREDYMDFHTGKIKNELGKKVPEIPRQMVDSNHLVACSKGYHVGTLKYAKSFNSHHLRHLLIVEVDPYDCVSVPNEPGEGSNAYSHKIRCTTYKVVGIYEEDLDSDYSARYNEIQPRDAKGRFMKKVSLAG